ncbi:MAG TPA: hypothetical protein VER37_01050, partial [Thermomicrobiales bacterium]|nr:hypothetical protein [Thermomicrobiales bacterium]
MLEETRFLQGKSEMLEDAFGCRVVSEDGRLEPIEPKLVEGERRQPTGGFSGKPKTPLGASNGISEDPERIIGTGNYAAQGGVSRKDSEGGDADEDSARPLERTQHVAGSGVERRAC